MRRPRPRRFSLALVLELGLALALTAGLTGCDTAGSQTSPAWNTCKSGATGAEALQRKVSACTQIVNAKPKPGDLEQALKSRADAYRDLNQNDLAIADDTRAIGLEPDDSRAVSDRGLAHYDQGRLDLALADFNAALKLDPDNDAAFNGRAYVEVHNGDNDGAIHDESRAIELNPEWAQPWLNRGVAYLDKGWFDMALADFADSLRLDRTNADLFEDIGLADADKGDKADAVTAYLSASSIYLDRKAYNEAIGEADKAIGVSPQDPGALNARCWARAVADTGLDLAEADCQRSLAVKPRDGETLDSLAFVRFRQGRFNEARQGFSDALAQNPKQAESLYMRGIVKLRLGDQDGGQADVAAAQTQDPTIPARYANWGVTPDASQ